MSINLVEYTEPTWRGLNMRDLHVDEAYFFLESLHENKTFLYGLMDACYTCPYEKLHVLQPSHGGIAKTVTLNLNVAHNWHFKLLENDVGRFAYENDTGMCDIKLPNLQEFGVYNLTLNNNGNCSFASDKTGVDVNISILSVFLLFAALLAFWKIAHCAWRSYLYMEGEITMDPAISLNASRETVEPASKQRLRSLDVFRGLAIVLMIFVNSGGGQYWWIDHAAWNGLHLADIVFPSFLWIMGVCIPISVRSQLSRGATKWQICRKIIWRSVKLFAIGVCLNSLNATQLEKLRLMGVLQRFGIAYLMCGVLHTVSSPRNYVLPPLNRGRLLKAEILMAILLMCVYAGIAFYLPVPDCPTGYLGPGGKHALAAFANCTGGAAGYIDRFILGPNHMYSHSTAKFIYDARAFDPEGIFGCLLTVLQVLCGVLCGHIILSNNHYLKRWLSCSLIFALCGGLLCNFSQEGGLIPINKNLWSLSYVFITVGLAFLLLSILYYFIDVKHYYTGYPFEACGKNAIIMYVGHTAMHKMLPWHWRIGVMNTHFILLLEATWNTLLWVCIALYLDIKKFYYNL